MDHDSWLYSGEGGPHEGSDAAQGERVAASHRNTADMLRRRREEAGVASGKVLCPKCANVYAAYCSVCKGLGMVDPSS